MAVLSDENDLKAPSVGRYLGAQLPGAQIIAQGLDEEDLPLGHAACSGPVDATLLFDGAVFGGS